MTSTRTQLSYLSPSLSPAPNALPTRRKLRKEEKDHGGYVLPQGSGSGYGQTNSYGQTSNGLDRGGIIAPRLQGAVRDAKVRRHRGGRRHADDLTRRNMLLDSDGNAHDSEYVQFRTATPVHLHSQQQRNQRNGFQPDDDDSASSSSSSASGSETNFPSNGFTYQSTQTTPHSNQHHHYATPLGTTISAIPPYLAPKPHRVAGDLNVPVAPSPRRSSADYDRPASLRSNALSSLGPSGASLRSYHGGGGISSRQPAMPTTSSYQPPAPAFNPRPMDFTSPLRNPSDAVRAQSRTSSADLNSLTDTIAKTSIAESAGGSGYNKFASESIRAPQLEGTALDAGVHGMKRSWDGFRLEMKFGAHKMGKKLERKAFKALS